MTITPALRAALRNAPANAARWALRRAREYSTWAGLAVLLTSLGYAAQAEQLGRVVNILVLAGIVTGTGLTAATTTPHLPPAPKAEA